MKRVEKEKRYTRGLFKNDLLETIEGIRLAYYSIMTKNGSRPFKRFYRSAQKDIKKLLGYKEVTVWDSLKKSKRI